MEATVAALAVRRDKAWADVAGRLMRSAASSNRYATRSRALHARIAARFRANEPRRPRDAVSFETRGETMREQRSLAMRSAMAAYGEGTRGARAGTPGTTLS